MGMNVGSGGGSDDPEVMVDINTTPLIDVMLVLLIMLIITIPIQLHAVNLDMPNNNQPKTNKPPEPPVRIVVDFDGTLYWNEAVIPDRPTLEAKLAEVAAKPDQQEVHVAPNKLVHYKHVAAVMASAQRLGVTKIGIVGNEQFVQ